MTRRCVRCGLDVETPARIGLVTCDACWRLAMQTQRRAMTRLSVGVLVCALIGLWGSARLDATTTFGAAFGNVGDNQIQLGYEAHLTDDLTFSSGRYTASESVWVQRVQLSYVCVNCSSAVLFDVLGDETFMFTPVILRATPMPCQLGQEPAATGGCFEHLHGTAEFMVERWVQTLRVRIQSRGTGTLEIQLLGTKGQMQYNPYHRALTDRLDWIGNLLRWLGGA